MFSIGNSYNMFFNYEIVEVKRFIIIEDECSSEDQGRNLQGLLGMWFDSDHAQGICILTQMLFCYIIGFSGSVQWEVKLEGRIECSAAVLADFSQVVHFIVCLYQVLLPITMKGA